MLEARGEKIVKSRPRSFCNLIWPVSTDSRIWSSVIWRSLSFGRRRRGIEPIVFDAVLVFEETDAVAPGARAIARAYVFDELPRHVEPVFTLLEGDRIVARAELLETLEDPSPQPLRDFAAAKRRELSP